VLICGGGAVEPANPILVNHLGFTPNGAKSCLMQGQQPVPFVIVRRQSGETVHRGVMTPRRGDLGHYVVGEFDDFITVGEFEIRAGASTSAGFVIDSLVYDFALQKCVGYFAKQRCGDSKTGHHAPCHLDDGRRADNQKHQNVAGGWHDACDLRKWVNATIYGMIGLERILEVAPPRWDNGQILDELRWGNQYFRRMQEPDGYVMDYCGGDDGNRYTNNITGDSDDRLIHVEPCELPVQFHFVAAQAALARHTRASDPVYAQSCAEAAQKCLNWCVNHRSPGAALTLAAAVTACVEMNRLTASEQIADLMAGYLRKMLSLQVGEPIDGNTPLRGFFLTAPDRQEPLREIMHGNLPLLALCEALTYFPSHPDATNWRKALKLHAEYLLFMSDRSAFGTIPFGLYTKEDPGGNRRIGSYWYRWFMKRRNETPTEDWWVGINAHLASNGIGLLKAGRLLGDPRLARLAQRQLDWIIGGNPYDASSVTGVGRKQPRLYRTTTFTPPTPLIPGGVMNGIGGSEQDEPAIDPGSWNTCEYWTPMVGYTMWLLNELQHNQI
jgi:hypothetical protein